MDFYVLLTVIWQATQPMTIAGMPAVKHTISAIEVKMDSLALCERHGLEAQQAIAKLPTVVKSEYTCTENWST